MSSKEPVNNLKVCQKDGLLMRECALPWSDKFFKMVTTIP